MYDAARLVTAATTSRDPRSRVSGEAGLIEGERRGTWVYYRPVKANLAQLAALLAVPEEGRAVVS